MKVAVSFYGFEAVDLSQFMSGFQLGREDSEGPKTGWAKRSPAETLKHGRHNLVPYPIWEGFP